MTYSLYIGNKRYSSWSMRPWVLLKALDVPFEEKLNLFKPGIRQPEFLSFSPSGKVPCLHDNTTSVVVWDSLAICEYIAESHPGAWPTDTRARAFARSAAAEMHSGFSSIRNECGMNVGMRITLASPSEGLKDDLRRLNELFNEGLEKFGGPWIAGKEFTIADAMFAPISSRCKTNGFGLVSGRPLGSQFTKRNAEQELEAMLRLQNKIEVKVEVEQQAWRERHHLIVWENLAF
ncbi:uncharacterized protein DNG_04072 [Cephalotrichum gorgonifer]|uniref:GST N-terminal domain-containing protein n=1 Tax=Cephalotrichum gorgonifer TaxID=2041049 RepID=A0AAE8MW88_9PEZI|nr:uncharacterized protein DNG_04072 [Cephalotrichum gorgonifer]